jgi:hypothetical protein
MDKFQGIFDQGFSGILDDTSKKTMPEYLEKLADSEIDYEPPQMDVPSITFDSNSSLSRANELTSDGSRESNINNRFSIEKEQRDAQDNKLKAIDNRFETLRIKGSSFDEIQSELLMHSSREQLNKYLESKIKLELNKYSYLGFEDIQEKHANLQEQSKFNFKITRSTVHDIFEKFSKIEYVTSSTIKEYKDLLSSKRPLYVAAKFLFSLDDIKKDYYEKKEARVAFQRDTDEKDLTLREVNNNLKRNQAQANQNILMQMINEFKQGINNKQSRSQIDKKLAKHYGFEKLQQFHSKYNGEIKKIERFASRQNFDTDFASSVQQGHEVQLDAKEEIVDNKAMLSYVYSLMTTGKTLEEIQASLDRKFGISAAIFWEGSKEFIAKRYGQLGYLFIDSNIYANCEEMAGIYSKLSHTGSKLIYSLKANPKCANCSLHKEGHCSKTGLMISNNPLVRSPRAARRVFERAASFVPKEYIDIYSSQIKKEESNLELVSKFALGIGEALAQEKKNIGKQASKDRTESTVVQENFITPENFDVEIFENINTSSIIDDVLGCLDKKAYNKNLKDWNVDVKSHISRGADPTQIQIVTLKKNNDKIILTEFMGIVQIDWRAPKEKGKKIPTHIPISRFAGEDRTKELDSLLESVGAPSWTEIMDDYDKRDDYE